MPTLQFDLSMNSEEVATTPDAASSMSVKELKAELTSYGISTHSFLDKESLVDAVKKARADQNSEICGNPDCKNTCSKDKVMVCAKCKSTPYCSRDCQVKHWKVHKKLCKSLNAGRSGQLNHPDHGKRAYSSQRGALVSKLVSAIATFPTPCQELHRLFASTTKDEDRGVIEKRVVQMKKVAMKISPNDKVAFLHYMAALLLRSKTWQVSLPTSPLLILIQTGVDVNDIPPNGHYSCLCLVAAQDSTKNVHQFNENQCIIGRQLIEAGANVNLATKESKDSPLMLACSSTLCTNLDFVELLLRHGADPNQQNSSGSTALACSIQMSVPAAIFVLRFKHENAVNVDVNVYDDKGNTVLADLRRAIGLNENAREVVATTGAAYPLSDKVWTSTDQYDILLAQFREMEGSTFSP